MKVWKKYNQDQIKKRVFDALDNNVNYFEENVLGIPATYLDSRVFSQDEMFLKDAPYITTLIHNPNHIGCHTLGLSESYFKGTHEIEKELLDICAIDILKCDPGSFDGYVAAGGTEANMQAIWVYRNYFINELKAKREEICILYSEDCHYSMEKSGNVLVLEMCEVKVTESTREITYNAVKKAVLRAQSEGKKYFIVVSNMMTTMFGSIDDVDVYSDVLLELNCEFKIHIDGAFGGFYYPFTDSESKLTFLNPHITSFTLDAHKMAQAPYGTGIFIIRKGYIHHANTQEAGYLEGDDYTLSGSRSGANAVAAWMILAKNGPYGWQEKIFILQKRTDWMCKKLRELNIELYRHLKSNILTIRAKYISKELAHDFGLVPDNQTEPKWYKIVIMEHVTIERLLPLIERLQGNK